MTLAHGKLAKKPDGKDYQRAWKVQVECARAERRYLQSLDACQEIYYLMRASCELEMSSLVVALARRLIPLNQTKLDAMLAFSRKMEEAAAWVAEQRRAHRAAAEQALQQQAEHAAAREGAKYQPLVQLLAAPALPAALRELSARPEMGSVQRVILPHIHRVFAAHSISTAQLEAMMQREFVEYAQQEQVSQPSVFQTELPSVANFLKTNYLDVANSLLLQNQRDTILQLACVLGQLFARRVI